MKFISFIIDLEGSPNRLYEKHLEDIDHNTGHQFSSLSNPGTPTSNSNKQKSEGFSGQIFKNIDWKSLLLKEIANEDEPYRELKISPSFSLHKWGVRKQDSLSWKHKVIEYQEFWDQEELELNVNVDMSLYAQNLNKQTMNFSSQYEKCYKNEGALVSMNLPIKSKSTPNKLKRGRKPKKSTPEQPKRQKLGEDMEGSQTCQPKLVDGEIQNYELGDSWWISDGTPGIPNLSKNTSRCTNDVDTPTLQKLSGIKTKRESKVVLKEKNTENLELLSWNSFDQKLRKKSKKKKYSYNSAKLENIDLAQRRDVVNKTILRALRRFFTQKLKEHSKIENVSEDTPQKEFFQNVREYWVTTFGVDHHNLVLLQYYLAFIISPKEVEIVPDNEDEAKDLEHLNAFYNCLYKYSHSKLVSLFSDKYIGMIYDYFYINAKQYVLENEPAMSRNVPLYTQIMDDFNKFFKIEDKSGICVT